MAMCNSFCDESKVEQSRITVFKYPCKECSKFKRIFPFSSSCEVISWLMNKAPTRIKISSFGTFGTFSHEKKGRGKLHEVLFLSVVLVTVFR